MKKWKPCAQSVQGSAMLLCLVLLTALTLLGLTATADQQLQIRIAGNQANIDQAERAAESALTWAEHWLYSLDGSSRPTSCTSPCGAGGIIEDAAAFPEKPELARRDWWIRRGHNPGVDPITGQPLEGRGADSTSLWIIGEIPVAPEYRQNGEAELGYYRVIAHATDSAGKQVAVTESIVARPWGNSDWSDALTLPAGTPRFCQRHALEPCGRLAWRRLR